jgi:phage shock protein C
MNSTTDIKRLRKSRTDRMLDGVCGGIAEYVQLDPTLVRIAWVLLTLFGGSGIILYILAMIIMPAAPITPAAPVQPKPAGNNTKFWGVLLIVLGTLWLMGNIGFPLHYHWWDFSWDVLLAALLIMAGVAFLFGGRNGLSVPKPAAAPAEGGTAAAEPGTVSHGEGRLYRSRTEKKLFGVCGGLGQYFSIDPTIIRLLFVVAVIASCGAAILAYIAMAILVPEERIVPGIS